jgi:hypothetical protein
MGILWGLDSVQTIFLAENVPIHFDIIDNFRWEGPVTRERLKKNPIILLVLFLLTIRDLNL